MQRLRIELTHAVQDGLGFAVSRFGQALRVAWLPLALMSGAQIGLPMVWDDGPGTFSFLLTQTGIVLLFQAIIMVPLVRMAAYGMPPHHRSLHLAFGKRELQYLLAAVLSVGLTAFVVTGAISGLGQLLDQFASTQELRTAYFFEEGSLHAGRSNLLYPEGYPLRRLAPALGFMGAVVVLYVSVRLYLYPAFIAAGISRPLRRALELSGGANTISLFLLLALSAAAMWGVFFAVGLLAGFASIIAGGVIRLAMIAQDLGIGVDAEGWAELLAGRLGMAGSFAGAFLLQLFEFAVLAGFTGAVARQTLRSE
ncbi:hypothetical protein [Parvularcula maris]|uniref:Uncharacterized protein n=1 Tax=Parvularcula maris TaxID=2965077 RepID=A0A9X2LAR1_9PROT|nr:hypothetical protein [Parvularcula maris]MCQ8185137.1 hypothetical protein [Parvularcula maris]